MNKEQKYFILLISIIVLLAAAFGVYAFTHKNKNVCKDEETDAIKFKREYEEFNGQTYKDTEIAYFDVNLKAKNLFVYVTEEEAVKFLEEGTGVIYFGFPQCPWCRTLVPYLQEIGSKYGVKDIKYLNILDIRDTYKVENKKAVIDKEGSENYYKLLELLDKHLRKFTITDEDNKNYDTGVKRLYASTIIAVSKKKIQYMHVNTVESQEDPYSTLNDDQKKELLNLYKDLFSTFDNEVCTSSSC